MNKSIHILIVEDDPETLNGTVRLLEKAGHFVDQATCGEETLLAIQEYRPHLLLLDRNLSGIDGIEICRRIKRSRALADIIVVIISDLGSDGAEKAEGFESGADGYIVRPISDRELLARVESYVRIIHLTRTLRHQAEELQQSNEAGRQLMEDAVADRDRAEQALLELRESENRFRAALENMSLIGLMLDMEGNLTLCNDFLLNLTGWRCDEVIGRNCFDIFLPAESRDLFKNRMLLEKSQAGSIPSHFEEEIVTRGGERRLVAWNNTVLQSHAGTVAGIVCIGEDITDRKRAEMELRKHQGHLEELVQERTVELAEARDQAQAANRAKSVFLANMSHELRTPLNAILGFAQIMSREHRLPAQEQDNLNIILRSGEHLLALINDILDLSKIDAGRTEVDLHDVDLKGLFRDVVDMMHLRARTKGLNLFLEVADNVPGVVRTDSGKLRQIVINLVGNAIKFTHAGQIVIRLAAEPLQADWRLIVEVEDTGIGIAKKDLGRIFQPFDQIGKQTEGTGLGLAISQKYVQMLGGEISVNSKLRKGSCFRFTILAGLSAAGCQPASRKPIGIKKAMPDLRILIVEDQTENRLLLRRFLEPHGFIIRECANGEEAVAIFQEWYPQLIFMDRRMPVLDGLEATRQIRSLLGGGGTVIVAVSAHSFKEEQQEMLDAGCNDFLAKPFSGESLLVLLERHFHLEPVYPEEKDPSGSVLRPLSADDLRNLPSKDLATLHRLALEGDDSDLAKWLETQKYLTPTVQSVLTDMVKNYRLDAIMKITESLMQGEPFAKPRGFAGSQEPGVSSQ